MVMKTMSNTHPPGNSGHGVERTELLEDVDFKWLMAGQGWWVDTGRIHTDPDYIHTMLNLASSTDSDVLHECAIHLQNHVPIGSPAG